MWRGIWQTDVIIILTPQRYNPINIMSRKLTETSKSHYHYLIRSLVISFKLSVSFLHRSICGLDRPELWHAHTTTVPSTFLFSSKRFTLFSPDSVMYLYPCLHPVRCHKARYIYELQEYVQWNHYNWDMLLIRKVFGLIRSCPDSALNCTNVILGTIYQFCFVDVIVILIMGVYCHFWYHKHSATSGL